MKKASVLGLVLAFVFALTGVLAGRASADVLVPPPDSDPFYVAPAGYASQPNGAVLRDRQIDAQYLLPFLSTSVLSEFGSAAEQFAPWFTELQNLKINATRCCTSPPTATISRRPASKQCSSRKGHGTATAAGR